MAGQIKVVIASLLKPVDEPRMYSKLGRTLAQTNKYDVNIIGFRSKNLPSDPLITFWPIFDFDRLSLQRLLAPIKYFQKLLQLKPEVLIVTSPDLLLVSCAYQRIYGCKFLYDIQENYLQNIIWSTNSPSISRTIAARVVRSIESFSDRMIIHYLLAERCYENECSFINKPFTVLENKAHKPLDLGAPLKVKSSTLKILFSGTIAEAYGIFDTLPLTDAIQQLHPGLQYTICGHCPLEEVHQQLKDAASTRPWIDLQISSQPIPHPQILQLLKHTDFSLVAYKLNPSSQDCFPTRIWEALAWQTPMILKEEHPWNNYLQKYGAGQSINFLQPDKERLKQILFEDRCYTSELPADIYWEFEGEKLKQVFDQLF